MEICRGLHRHEVVMAIGGPPFDAPVPSNVRIERLPPMAMGDDYATLQSDDALRPIEEVKAARRARLHQLYCETQADVLLIELYPFGRRKFKFELVPLLEGIRSGAVPPAKVVCSLRDILVSKQDAAGYEADVVQKLNDYFDALLVHADRQLITLDQTFGSTAAIAIPLVYTGFVVQSPPTEAAVQIRRQLQLANGEQLVVVSAGGGRSGAPLLEAVLMAFQWDTLRRNRRVFLFTGPFIDPDDADRLAAIKPPGVTISTFSDDFLALLSAADLSISMGGYNTSMNILATGVPALVWPYPGDQEQGLRTGRLSDKGLLKVLTEADFPPDRMVPIIEQALRSPGRAAGSIAMDGAPQTARFIESMLASD
jgi:predicted glycosyltransferase